MGVAGARSVVDEPTLQVRARIAAAGRELFSANGYERTTVEAIAERAGVGRRTFFRHFRGKDDVIFIDHERVAASVEAHLAALDHLDPLQAVCSGVRMVSRSYIEAPAISVQCYALIRSVPALRDREIAWVSNYTRLFARYLRTRLGSNGTAPLVAEVGAAALVAAHNQVLRSWLQGGGVGDPSAELDRAMTWVLERLDAGESAGASTSGQDVVVAVFRADDSLNEVVDRISRSL